MDIEEYRALAEKRHPASRASLEAAAELLRQPLLTGLELPQQDGYQSWLTAERHEAERLRRTLLAQLCEDPDAEPEQLLPWCREWAACDPFNPCAVAALFGVLKKLGKPGEADEVARDYRKAAAEAGVEAADLELPQVAALQAVPPTGRQLLQRQKIRFCTARDGVRIAYATVGGGPPLVKAANWLNHLELDWDAPIWAPMFRELARDHCFIRYDERGNGLSDWDVADISFPAFVTDLEAVVDAAGVDRFPLLGISQGCAVAIDYAVRHPERVSHLILWGGYAAGWQADATPAVRAEREAIITLVREGWGRDDPAYRHIFSSSFMPCATPDELAWFNEFQRRTTSGANAARFLEVFGHIDVRDRLAQVSAPTLVMHARGDQRIPLATGGRLAAGIPDAEFVTLDSDNHILLGREPASLAFVSQVRDFIERPAGLDALLTAEMSGPVCPRPVLCGV